MYCTALYCTAVPVLGLAGAGVPGDHEGAAGVPPAAAPAKLAAVAEHRGGVVLLLPRHRSGGNTPSVQIEQEEDEYNV